MSEQVIAKKYTATAGATNTALVAVMAAMLAVMSLLPAIPLGSIGVPITLQTLGVALAGLCLGPVRGFLAVALYLILGLAGLPIFAGGTGGLAVLLQPSAGYLMSFAFAAGLSGFVAAYAAKKNKRHLWAYFLVGVLAARYLVILPLGVAGLMLNADLSLQAAVLVDMPFWVGDLIKAAAAVTIALAVHKAFPRILGH